METRQITRFNIFRTLCKERVDNLGEVLDWHERGFLIYVIRQARNLEDVKSRWFKGFYAKANRELFQNLYKLSDRLAKKDPFSSETPHFTTFKELCEDHREQNMSEDDMDLEAMGDVLKCKSFQEVWESVVTPYNETYFRELVQTLEEAALTLVEGESTQYILQLT